MHADITKADELLGYEPTGTLCEGARQFLEWSRANEDWSDPLVGTHSDAALRVSLASHQVVVTVPPTTDAPATLLAPSATTGQSGVHAGLVQRRDGRCPTVSSTTWSEGFWHELPWPDELELLRNEFTLWSRSDGAVILIPPTIYAGSLLIFQE